MSPALVLILSAVAAADPPRTLYGHDLRVRPAGAKDFTKETPKVGIEVVHDPAGNALLYLTETGALAATSFAAGKAEPADWQYGLDLRVRTAAEATFTKDTKKLSVEAFKDPVGGRLLYVTEAKTVAVGPVPANLKTNGDPTFVYGLTLNVRTGGDTAWDKAKKFGVEVYSDGNTGGLLYVTETGAVAAYASPANLPAGGAKGPKHLFGLDLRVRGSDEGGFTTQTRRLAVEAFADPNSGAMLYVTETGSLAAVPPTDVKPSQKPTWLHGVSVRARPGGEREFGKAKVFGVEAFRDGHTGYVVYALDAGGIAVVK